MRIVELRRHAERDANEDLTARGLEQCARARETLDFPYDAFVTGPAKRARLTMEALGGTATAVDPRIGPRPRRPFLEFEKRHRDLDASQRNAKPQSPHQDHRLPADAHTPVELEAWSFPDGLLAIYRSWMLVLDASGLSTRQRPNLLD